jgi:predicted MFS family arabinose efflux permease
MSVRAKHVFFAAFGLMTLFVFYTYEAPFLDSRSPVWQRIEPVKWLMLLHGPAGALGCTVFSAGSTWPA